MYQRTALGQQEILERNLKISSRARTLLLLIESYDLDRLETNIAHPQHFEALLNLGLIIKTNTITDQNHLNKNDHHTKNMDIQETQIDSLKEEVLPLNFVEIKIMMQDTLKQYCGLMAKHLIHAIEQSKTIDELRIHQKKWLTDLFETRISRQNLTNLKNRINISINAIERNYQQLT